MLLFWPLARALAAWRRPAGWRVGVALALLLLLAATTFNRASLWGHPEMMSRLWALKGAGSSRAQAAAAIAEAQAGRPGEAKRLLDAAWRDKPDDLQLAFNYVDASCAAGGLDGDTVRRVAVALETAPRAQLLMHRWLGAAVDVAAEQACPGLGLAHVQAWIDAAMRNPAINRAGVREQDLDPLLGRLALRKGDPQEALAHFDRALRGYPSPDVAARQASMLASGGYFEQALAHLDTYEAVRHQVRAPDPGMRWLHARVFEWQGYWPREMALLRKHLREAMAARDAAR
jgi:tetratricopeptide (TPR) repeat protein